jgi:hypothetical protein
MMADSKNEQDRSLFDNDDICRIIHKQLSGLYRSKMTSRDT